MTSVTFHLVEVFNIPVFDKSPCSDMMRYVINIPKVTPIKNRVILKNLCPRKHTNSPNMSKKAHKNFH